MQSIIFRGAAQPIHLQATRLLRFLLLITLPVLSSALRNVSVTIPLAVKTSDNVFLICNYDMENDNLYSVKWYRGRREFYRYTPKERPAMKFFPVGGVNHIDLSQSNATHVLLRKPISGKYSCEVSADAPSFDTFVVSAEMEVVELPTQRPIITGIRSRYQLGDTIMGNCSSDDSKPAANLSWSINEVPVPPSYVRIFDVHKELNENLADDNLESAVAQIQFIVTQMHFYNGRLKLKCTARIYNIYVQESEKLIEEDRPRILASGRSPNMNPYELDVEGGGYDVYNDLYLLQNKNYVISAGCSFRFPPHLLSALKGYALVTIVLSLLQLWSGRRFAPTATTTHTLTTLFTDTSSRPPVKRKFNPLLAASHNNADKDFHSVSHKIDWKYVPVAKCQTKRQILTNLR